MNFSAAAQTTGALYHPLFDLNTTVYVQNPGSTAQAVTAQVYSPSGSSPVKPGKS